MRHLRRSALVPPLLAAALLFTGCATTRPLPPALYQGELATAFDALPPELRSTDADVLYATDRTPEPDDDGALQYGFGRSRSLAFGSAVVSLATDTTWDELVSWTRSQSAGPLAPEPILARVDELGRLPATPFPFVVGDDGRPVPSPDARIDTERAADGLRAELRRRLQLAANKVVTISIHGIQNSFADAMENAALIWHQLGRRNVPLVYSWPAGRGGIVRGYTYDRESGEFTVYHLKQLLRIVASVPEVERIVVAAHSRGTDVALSALRELIIEQRAADRDPRDALRVAHLVLLAPDLDMEVVAQRVMAENLNEAFERMTLYTSARDSAIGAAVSLFGSTQRAGRMRPEDVDFRTRNRLRKLASVDVIFYDGRSGGAFGHSYYRSPPVAADLALLLGGAEAGAAHGRPLEQLDDHLWLIRDDYLR